MPVRRRGADASRGRDTTFLVTNMMRSVINEGTGAGARAAGFALDAAGKSGTTNDLRDAWFVGFTPELLTVVWVGLDDNQPRRPERHPGRAAHLDDVHDAGARRAAEPAVRAPRGLAFVDIDKDTGKVAAAGCPRIFREAFIAGTEPTEICALHSF